MSALLEQILSLEQLDLNLFRSQMHCENFRKALFGGQVLSQALMAMYNTQDEQLPNSLHAYFLRAGSSETPVIYDVEKVRDGRSFASRRAVARQFGRPIFNMSTSFHKPESGFEHQEAFPEDIPDPEDLLRIQQKTGSRKAFEQDNSVTPFELVTVGDAVFSKGIIDPPIGYFWIKCIDRLPDTPIIHYCALAFASDLGLLASALFPHPATVFDKGIIAASVDHAMWFHSSEFRADEWLLCKIESPWAGHARGFAQARIYNRNKKLIASTAQEGLIRPI